MLNRAHNIASSTHKMVSAMVPKKVKVAHDTISSNAAKGTVYGGMIGAGLTFALGEYGDMLNGILIGGMLGANDVTKEVVSEMENGVIKNSKRAVVGFGVGAVIGAIGGTLYGVYQAGFGPAKVEAPVVKAQPSTQGIFKADKKADKATATPLSPIAEVGAAPVKKMG